MVAHLPRRQLVKVGPEQHAAKQPGQKKDTESHASPLATLDARGSTRTRCGFEAMRRRFAGRGPPSVVSQAGRSRAPSTPETNYLAALPSHHCT
jgi:hypothetical protein